MTLHMGLDGQELSVVEKSLGQQMYFTLQEKAKEQAGDQSSLMNSSAKTSMDQNNNKKKMFRWLATGAGVVGGGAVIGTCETKKRLSSLICSLTLLLLS